MSAMQNELQRGWQIHQQRHFAEAERIYRDVLGKSPNDANAWCFLGIALHDQRQYASAVECYRKALKLNPEFPIALNNLGNSLRYVNCVEEADQCFQKAIDLKPDYLNAFKNRGTLHVWTGNLERGLAYYEQALKINPNEAELHRNLGVIYLLQGRYEEGWNEYRWRWKVGDLHRANKSIPVWDGSDVAGRRILLTAEQGLGDTLNFVRFAQVLRSRGAHTLVHCQPQLLALLQNAPKLGAMYPNSLNIEQPMDAQCSLVDVADILHLNEQSIPSDSPYLFPSPQLANYWARRFPKKVTPNSTPHSKPGACRVGIAWQGNPDHQADIFRSIPLARFEPLAEVPGVELISLQSGFGAEQLTTWRGAKPIVALGSEVDKTSGAFMDTAAIMLQLDLVITSDTSIAHLAGALGVPTWLALNYVPDWRWLLQREDSPWYPTLRLFRQDSLGDWSGVFSKIQQALLERTRVAHEA
ncbi:MAG: tetratricopeptide repeat-containing glycosyltransferase family protein [Pirellulaceae bacterium]|nr:tetratricopeptide repeat-containing glycosyltransferase family protein [Pirellulaceae bacterium]